MSEWQEYLLEDVIEKFIDYRGKTPDKKDAGIPLITAKIVKAGKILPANEFIAVEDYDSWMTRGLPEINDIVLTTEAPLGELALIKNTNVALAQRIITLRGKKNLVFNPFLKYYFQSELGQHELQSRASGTTVFGIKASVLKKVPVNLPEISEQQAIANILSSLDDKIDLLHRQNKTLEAMVETLFRQWFIEEANEDWEDGKLGDVAIVQNGFAFNSKDYVEYQDGHLEVFKMGHIKPGGGLRFSPKADYVPRIEKLERWTLKQGDIVMAMTDMKDSMGILGHPAMIDISNKYVLNQRVARIYLENSNNLLTNYFLYLQLNTDDAIALLQSKANSGVQVNLSTEAIKSLPLIIPPKETQKKVLKSIEPMFKKIEANRKQIQILEKLRDNLLPKLMSGEIRIY